MGFADGTPGPRRPAPSTKIGKIKEINPAEIAET
jgi:hypothetical protein